MNRIDTTFMKLKEKGESALVGFVTAGDPDYSLSLDIVKTMCAAGLYILAYGPVVFYDEAMAAGADGVLVVDLPPEELDEMIGLWPDEALSLIRLVAPTTPGDRMAILPKPLPGFFIWCQKQVLPAVMDWTLQRLPPTRRP
jgi:tryptophan synthase alpha subunit